MTSQRDDNLENFFLNRINEYNIDYREEDWQKLNEMLNASNAVKAAALKQKIAWIGSGAMLVISIALLLWMSRNLTSQSAPGNSSKTEETDIRSQDENKQAVQPLMLDEYPESPDQKSSEGNVGITDNPVITDPGQADKLDLDVKSGREKPADTFTGKKEGKQLVIEEDPDNDVQLSENPDQYLPFKTENESDESKREILSISESIEVRDPVFSTLDPGGPYLLLNEAQMNIGLDLKNDIPSMDLRRNYSWNLSVAADNSAVGMNDFDGPSLRLGLSLEYFISKRLSVMAGANYSAKTYRAYGREYTPPYGFWTKGIVPDETLGECGVLDVPIHLSFYFPNAKGQALYLRAGLSSWLMLEEHYYYKYQSNDPDLVKYWGGENENYHYFSVLDLSVGFEHPLNRKFSILIEPYLNIPLGGVGFGKVDLYSAGLKTALRINHYKLSLKKQ